MSNLFELTNRRFLITGGCGLLGIQHAVAIAKFGGIPILVDVDISKKAEITNSIHSQTGIYPEIYKLDITSEDDVIELSNFLKEKPLHGLVNNAALNQCWIPAPSPTQEEEYFRWNKGFPSH